MYVESVMNMLKGKMRIIKKIVKNNKLLSDISIKIQCSLTFCFIDCHWKYFLPSEHDERQDEDYKEDSEK